MQVTRGRVLLQRFFDFADEIDLKAAERLLQHHAKPSQSRSRSIRLLRVPRPPLEIALPSRSCGLSDTAEARLTFHLYDVGVIAVTFEVPMISPSSPAALIELSARVEADTDAITLAGRGVAEEILATIRTACTVPGLSPIHEDYTIFAVDGTEPALTAQALAKEIDVARVLLGELQPISNEERDYVNEESFSYDPGNLVVVSWNSALTFGEAADPRVADLLEVANMQLLELRVYEDMVERYLDRLYDEIDRGEVAWFRSAKYQRLSREIMKLLADVTEITERADNSLQWLGDTWYARVHRGAVRAFGLRRWEHQLEHKLELLRQLNEHIVAQLTTGQSLRLEVAIVLLIVLEIVLALFEVA
jgi:hypothetical protein